MMNFNDLDKLMRVYEQSLDQVILPDMYIVARLDGRSFTKFTKEVCKFDAPFDTRFSDLMVETTKYLMENSGFQIIYGYTESDEISLLFRLNDNTFGRKVRKINTTLAGEASAFFTSNLQKAIIEDIIDIDDDKDFPIATFDCRVCPLPNIDTVKRYFIWRQEDANRNALNGYCYWTLRKNGKSKQSATSILSGKGVAFKNELLFQNGINYNDCPSWQKRGTGLYSTVVDKEGFNPKLGVKVITKRNTIKLDYDLPYGDDYAIYIENLLNINN